MICSLYHSFHGGHSHGKVRESDTGRGKVWEIVLPVVCYHSFDSHEINLTRVLLSKVDMHNLDLQ